MNEENKIVETATKAETETDELTKVVEETLEKVRTQAMLLGAQAMCSVILEKIATVKAQPGKRTLRDYERLIKDVEQFCRIGLSRKVNLDGTTSPVDDNTKLMEE